MDRDTHGSCWCLRLQEHQWTSKGFKVFHHIEHQCGSLLLAERLLQTLPNFQIPSSAIQYKLLYSTPWAKTSKLWTDFHFMQQGDQQLYSTTYPFKYTILSSVSFDYFYFFVIFMSLILPWFPEQKAQVLNSMVLSIWGDSVSMYYNYVKIQNNIMQILLIDNKCTFNYTRKILEWNSEFEVQCRKLKTLYSQEYFHLSSN